MANTLYGSTKQTASIASGGTTSQPIGLQGNRLLAIQTPAALTGTALTFLASFDDETYAPLYNSSGAVSVTVAASRYIAVEPADFAGVEYLKVVSGSAEGAARSITLVCGKVLAN